MARKNRTILVVVGALVVVILALTVSAAIKGVQSRAVPIVERVVPADDNARFVKRQTRRPPDTPRPTRVPGSPTESSPPPATSTSPPPSSTSTSPPPPSTSTSPPPVPPPSTTASPSPTSTPPPPGEDKPDVNSVFIENLVYSGSGCPPGSAAVNFNPSRTTFTVLYSSWIASIGPNVPITETRKNCVINCRVHLPQGFQYSIVTVDWRGYVKIDAGITGVMDSAYYFSSELEQMSVKSPFVGPLTQDYVFRDQFDIATVVWSPCGRSENLNINARISLDNSKNSTGTGLFTTDSTDGKFKQILGVVWRKC